MKLSFTRAAFLLLALTGAVAVKAQVDPHFSQYYVYPSWLNPALTGVFDGDYRVSGIYRNQWSGMSDGFVTGGASAEFNTQKNVSWGLSLFHQRAGSGGYYNTSAYGTMAYEGVTFGAANQHRVVMAMQAGVLSRGFNRSKLIFRDQYDQTTGAINPVTGEVLDRLSATTPDIGAGVLYFDASQGKKANLYGGFSVSHLTRPRDYFSAGGDAKLPMRYTLHAGVRLMLSEQVSITPNALYLKQGTADEKMVGAYMQMNAAAGTDLMIGLNYRLKDAFSPYAGVYFNNMVLGFSYDVNTSDLGKVAGGGNSFEVSLSFTGRKRAKAKEYEFVCPRL